MQLTDDGAVSLNRKTDMPTPTPGSELITTERVAIIVKYLLTGGTASIKELAEKAECSERNTRRMLEKISRVLAIRDEGGKWFVSE